MGLIILLLVLVPTTVRADMGPKPTAVIKVYYNGELVEEDFQAKMLVCNEGKANSDSDAGGDVVSQLLVNIPDETRNCNWQPAGSWTWGGNCTGGVCKFNYSLPDEFKLAVYIPSLDQTFVSNNIIRKLYYSEYELMLWPDREAQIIDTTPLFTEKEIVPYIVFFSISFVLILIAAYISCLILKIGAKKTIYPVISNIVNLVIFAVLFELGEYVWDFLRMIMIIVVLFGMNVLLTYIFSGKKIKLSHSIILGLIIFIINFAVFSVVTTVYTIIL
ncbi:hypothetical protein KJ855_03955 [Patescibacteria group bacterium]|nr:hypothetical protein [Patescibacteria group bacterium]